MMHGLRGRWEDRKDFLGGLLMLVLGLLVWVQAYGYNIGSLRRMGPGFFPLALGVILAVTGVLIMVTAKPPGAPVDRLAPEWRGWLCICAGIGAFVLLGQYTGLIPATFAVVFVSALGDRQNTILGAGVLGVVMTAACVVIFWWLLQVPFPLVHWG